MSYDEVAGLLERVTGQPLLSDQTIQHLVVAKAVEVSQQWQAESQADTAVPLWPEVTPQVDWYDPQHEEVLLLTDAMQVKQQKASRGQGADTPTVECETTRVHTEVWLVEQPTGGFTYLTAGIDATGQEVVSGTARVRGSSSKTTLAGLSHYRSSRSRMAPEQYAVSWQSCLTSQCP